MEKYRFNYVEFDGMQAFEVVKLLEAGKITPARAQQEIDKFEDARKEDEKQTAEKGLPANGGIKPIGSHESNRGRKEGGPTSAKFVALEAGENLPGWIKTLPATEVKLKMGDKEVAVKTPGKREAYLCETDSVGDVYLVHCLTGQQPERRLLVKFEEIEKKFKKLSQ